ncbi:MAG: 3-hydroxyacyl-CoA dehydrogenase family protein [Bacillota bacterium]|nr:3-hydroxyacyl-CoA dehydrogenase family protein [Bacillota bacterium]
MAENIEKLGVLGAGVMGAAIAHTAALHGISAVCVDLEPSILEKARARLDQLMKERISRGKMAEEEREAVWQRLHFSVDFDAFQEATWIVEAIVEDLEVKKDAFSRLDAVAPQARLLASNSSSLSITAMAAATRRPERVLGLHFFNPPQVMKLVEVVSGLETSSETLAEGNALAQRMGRVPVLVKKDRPGYIVNRILMAQFVEALRLLEEGVASIEDIDTAVKLGLNYPMGPFTLMDFTGNDVNLHVLEYLFTETGEAHYKPPLVLKNLYISGRLGRKTGKGFYTYES